jgi:hypothetical protein
MRDKHPDTRSKTCSGLASQVLKNGFCKTRFRVVELPDVEPPTNNNNNDPPTRRPSSPLTEYQQSRVEPPPPTQRPPPLMQHSMAAKSLCDLVLNFDSKRTTVHRNSPTHE